MKLNRKKLTDLIAKSGMSLAELAEKANVCITTLNRIVRHGKNAHLTTIGRIAEALGCEPSYLLSDEV